MVGVLYSAVATTLNTLLYPTGLSIPTGPPRIRRSVKLTDEQMARRNAELSRLLDEDRDVEGGGAAGPAAGRSMDPAEGGADDGGWHGGQAAPQMLTTEAGFCVECEAPAAMRCEQCDDEYCVRPPSQSAVACDFERFSDRLLVTPGGVLPGAAPEGQAREAPGHPSGWVSTRAIRRCSCFQEDF